MKGIWTRTELARHWRFPLAYSLGLAAFGAAALGYGFLPPKLASLTLISGSFGALIVVRRMFVESSPSAQPQRQDEALASQTKLAVALGAVIAGLVFGLALSGFSSLIIELVAVLVSVAVIAVALVVGWQRGSTRHP